MYSFTCFNNRKLLQILACLSAASFFFPSGFSLAFSAVLIPQLQQPFSDIPVTTEDISWIGKHIPYKFRWLSYAINKIHIRYAIDRYLKIPEVRDWLPLHVTLVNVLRSRGNGRKPGLGKGMKLVSADRSIMGGFRIFKIESNVRLIYYCNLIPTVVKCINKTSLPLSLLYLTKTIKHIKQRNYSLR